MNDKNEQAGSRQSESDLQPCCDGGSCCPSGSDGGNKSWKIVVFILIVLAAGAVLARSLLRKSDSPTEQGQNTFAAIQPELDSLALLDKAAANSDAVFILLAAEDRQSNQAATRQIEAAIRKIQTGGTTISAFRLRQGAPNFANFAKQLSVPCVLAMVKGGGLSGVSADQITEAKLVQAFVTASRPSSGCCPPGSGASCP